MGSEPRRVLHFVAHGFAGGAEKALYELIRTFAGDGEYPAAAALGRSDGLYAGKIRDLGVPIVELKTRGGFQLRFNGPLLEELGRYDIHHFHNPSPNHVLMSLAARGGAVRVLTRRGGFIDYRREGLKNALKYTLLNVLIRRCFRGYSGNTANAAGFVRRFHGVRHRPVRVLYNGLDFGRLRPGRPAAEVRASLGLGDGHFVVATAGHLIGIKRMDLLVRAFARCPVAGKRLVLLGDGPERHALEKLAASLGVVDETVFAGEVAAIGDYLQVLDCFVLASGREESFGNALVEAMYMKVPAVVMADSPGLLEHVTDGATGYVAADEAGLAAKMKDIREQPAEAASIAARASQFAANRYTLARMKERYREFYREALDVSSPSPP